MDCAGNGIGQSTRNTLSNAIFSLSISLFIAEKEQCNVDTTYTRSKMEPLHTSISQLLLRVGRRDSSQNVAKNVLFPETLVAKRSNKNCTRCGTTGTTIARSNTPLKGQWPQ